MKKLILHFNKFQDTVHKLSLLSKSRIELLWQLHQIKPESVYGFANSIKKSQPFVKKEIEVLADLGMVEIKKEKINGRYRVKPEISYSLLAIEIDFLGDVAPIERVKKSQSKKSEMAVSNEASSNNQKQDFTIFSQQKNLNINSSNIKPKIKAKNISLQSEDKVIQKSILSSKKKIKSIETILKQLKPQKNKINDLKVTTPKTEKKAKPKSFIKNKRIKK